MLIYYTADSTQRLILYSVGLSTPNPMCAGKTGRSHSQGNLARAGLFLAWEESRSSTASLWALPHALIADHLRRRPGHEL